MRQCGRACAGEDGVFGGVANTPQSLKSSHAARQNPELWRYREPGERANHVCGAQVGDSALDGSPSSWSNSTLRVWVQVRRNQKTAREHAGRQCVAAQLVSRKKKAQWPRLPSTRLRICRASQCRSRQQCSRGAVIGAGKMSREISVREHDGAAISRTRVAGGRRRSLCGVLAEDRPTHVGQGFPTAHRDTPRAALPWSERHLFFSSVPLSIVARRLQKKMF